VAQAFANIATISILQARETHDARVVIDQLQRALDTRVVIEQAKGFIAHHANVTLDESFARIRRYSRNNKLRLSNVAQDIVANVLDPQLLIET
jgi:AmiR/NasT family two-component response regulator